MSATLFIGTTAQEIEDILLKKFKKETRTEKFEEDLFDLNDNKVSIIEAFTENEYYSLNGFENDWMLAKYFNVEEFFGGEGLEYYDSKSYCLKEDCIGLELATISTDGNYVEIFNSELMKEVTDEMNSILLKFDIKVNLKVFFVLDNDA